MEKLLNLYKVGPTHPFFLIAGPCVIESETMALDTAFFLKELTDKLNIFFIYKSSFYKANRSSLKSFRGLTFDISLQILQKIKKLINVPILTDVHEDTPLKEVAKVVDILQIPAFLCRQTNFILNVCSQNLPVNIKKGQFLSPFDMKYVVEKAKSTGNDNIMLCERGVIFGYNNLISDMQSLEIMRSFNCPIIYDVTHSVQYPGGNQSHSGGERRFVPILARAAIASGVSGVFIETHPNPKQAMSDSSTMWPMHKMESLLKILKKIDVVVKTECFNNPL